MKKTLKTIIALVITASMLVGCTMREQIGLSITNKGNVTLKMVMAMDDEMIDAMITMKEDPNATEAKTYTDEQRWAYIESDDDSSIGSDIGDEFKKERYTKDNFKGILASQELGTLDEISGTSATKRVNIFDSTEGSDLSKQVLFIKDGDTYKSNMTIDLGEEAGEMSSYQQMGAAFELKFVLELPSKPISHNATDVSSDGKTLTWDLLTAKDIEVEFKLAGGSSTGIDDDDDDDGKTTGKDTDDKKDEDKKKESKKDDDDDEKDNKLWLYVGIGGGAGLLILIIIIVAVSASKKKKAQNAQAAMVQNQTVMAPSFNEPPVQPIQPAQPVEIAQPEQPVDPNQQQ